MQSRLNYRRTFFIGLAFLSIAGFWQMYDNIVPLILHQTFRLGETVTGVIMALDNVLALFLLPLFGALSDRVQTPLGKRMPFIMGGTALAVFFMMLLPVAERKENLALFGAALFMTLVSMGLYRSPAVALMPDLTPNALRSRANAIINLMGAVGGIYALIVIRLLLGKEQERDYTPLFGAVAGLMAASVLILALTIRENRLKEQLRAKEIPEEREGAGGNAELPDGEKSGRESEPLAPEVRRSMALILLSIFFWFTAYNAVTTAFSRYAATVWKMEGGGFASCLMVATVAAILSYIPIGEISGRIGRKRTIMGGVALMAVCYGAAVFAVEYHPVINVAFALIGVAWAAINVNSYPMIVAMSKGANIGKYTGTYYTFSMAAQILTPILSGFLLEKISYRTLFPYAVFFSLLALATMSRVKHGDVLPVRRESVLERFDVDGD